MTSETLSDKTVSIDIANLTHVFADTSGRRMVRALDDVTLKVPESHFLAIIGPSGCGKTTLFNIVAGLTAGTHGTVLVNGQRPMVGDPDVGYLFARDALLPWRTAVENVELSLQLRGVGARERRGRALEMLRSVGLADAAKAYPAELSHGMKQRVAIARTLVTEPRILLMDEPFSALDAQTRLIVQDLFVNLWQRLKATVVLITHDLGEAVALADSVAVMSGSPGRIKHEYDIDIERPRRIADVQANPRFHELYSLIWSDLRDEFYGASERSPESAASIGGA